VRPQKIILGGGLLLAPGLIREVRRELMGLLGDYLELAPEDLDALISLPGLGDDAGMLGGVHLALSTSATRINTTKSREDTR
jgi:fructokinase